MPLSRASKTQSAEIVESGRTTLSWSSISDYEYTKSAQIVLADSYDLDTHEVIISAQGALEGDYGFQFWLASDGTIQMRTLYQTQNHAIDWAIKKYTGLPAAIQRGRTRITTTGGAAGGYYDITLASSLPNYQNTEILANHRGYLPFYPPSTGNYMTMFSLQLVNESTLRMHYAQAGNVSGYLCWTVVPLGY